MTSSLRCLGLTIAVCCGALIPRGASAQPPVYFLQWGGTGGTNGQFIGPFHVAADKNSNVYVVDNGNSRIQKFTATGAYVTQWGGPGTGPGAFINPQGIAVDTTGNVYVVDKGNRRVQKFTDSGTYVTAWGVPGGGNGQFNNPIGVATDPAGNVYVADTGNGRIQKFTAAGTYVTQWSATGATAVATDAANNVYVAELSNRVQKFTDTGTLLLQWGSFGGGNGQFAAPYGITTDDSGDVYVADTNNNRIQKFTNTGTYLTQWGFPGSGDGQFDQPLGVACANDTIYVTDFVNDRVQAFTTAAATLPKIVSTSGPGGTIAPAGIVFVPFGGSQPYTITPNAGYDIIDVQVDSVSIGPQATYTFTNVTADHLIHAIFCDFYTITASGPEGCTIAPPGTTSVCAGIDVTYSVVPPYGYHIDQILVDGVPSGSGFFYTFYNVNANHTLQVTCALNEYTISASAGPNGSVVPSGQTIVQHGSNQTYTFIPDLGFSVRDVLVDSVSVGRPTSYTFTDIERAHVVYAEFCQADPNPTPIRILTLTNERAGTCQDTLRYGFEVGNAFRTAYEWLAAAQFGCSEATRTVEFLPAVGEISGAALSNADVVLLCILPPAGEPLLSDCEIALLSQFVEQGGGLFAFCNGAGGALGPVFGATPGPGTNGYFSLVETSAVAKGSFRPCRFAGTSDWHETFSDLGPFGEAFFEPGPVGATFSVGAGRAAIVCDEEWCMSLGYPDCALALGNTVNYNAFLNVVEYIIPHSGFSFVEPNAATAFPVKVFADSFGVGGEANWTPLNNLTVDVAKWNPNTPSNPYTILGTSTTDANGVLHLGDFPEFEPLDPFVLIYHGYSDMGGTRPEHEAVGGSVYDMTIDNLYIRPDDGRVIAPWLPSCRAKTTTTFLTHPFAHFNLVASIEWPSAEEPDNSSYVNCLQAMFTRASNYLFDVSNGQAAFGKIAIYDNKGHWGSADLRIFADNTQWANANVRGSYVVNAAGPRIAFPPVFRGNVFANVDAALLSCPANEPSHPRTFVHEFGHYGLGFFDEYINKSGQAVYPDEWAGHPATQPNINFGFMDYQYAGGDTRGYGMDSEMSWDPAPWYSATQHASTAQAENNTGLMCAQQFIAEYSRPNDFVPARFKYTPADYLRTFVGTRWFDGPNEAGDIDPTGMSVGGSAFLSFPVIEVTPTGAQGVRTPVLQLGGAPAAGVAVRLVKTFSSLDLGLTTAGDGTAGNPGGQVKLLGADPGDVVIASALTLMPPAQVLYTVPAPLAKAATMDTLDLVPISGDYRLLARSEFVDSGTIRYEVSASRAFGGPASIRLFGESGASSAPLSGNGTTYEATVTSTASGMILLNAVDSLGVSFVAFHDLESFLVGSERELRSSRPQAILALDSSSVGVERVGFLGTDFPPPQDGLTPGALRLSPVVYIAVEPTGAALTGRFSLVYQAPGATGDSSQARGNIAPPDDRLGRESGGNVLPIHIYKWQNAWSPLETALDGSRTATAAIQSSGYYAVFADSGAGATGVPADHDPGHESRSLILEPNYPNPSGLATTIRFVLPRTGTVGLRVYDSAGRLVRTLLAGDVRASGQQTTAWDGRNDAGRVVSSGIYILRLEAGGEVVSRRITIMK